MRIAMFQPDIPQNLGAMIRLCACVGVGLDIIEPCGFPLDDKKIRKSGMDYLSQISFARHNSWKTFMQHYANERIILMSTKAATHYIDFAFQDNDILLAGSESSGAPDFVHEHAFARVKVPMDGQARSMNIVNATSMIAGEALRQTKWISL